MIDKSCGIYSKNNLSYRFGLATRDTPGRSSWVTNFRFSYLEPRTFEENEMKNRRIVISIAFLALVGTSIQQVNAFPQFNGGFKRLYLNDNTPEEFKKKVTKAKCTICHDETKKTDKGKPDRKFRNPYGQALEKLLTKKDKKDKEKIRKSLEKVEEEKVPDSDETFGERIKNHQLPVEVETSEE